MANERTVEGFVVMKPFEDISDPDKPVPVHFVHILGDPSRSAVVPREALEAAGVDFDAQPDQTSEPVVTALVDLDVPIDYPGNVKELTFKGWLPGLDQPFDFGEM